MKKEPVFTALIRKGRFSREQLDQSMEFTVNIPYREYNYRIIGYCCSRSGRKIGKTKDLGLTLVAGKTIETPAIRELPLTLECKVLYMQLQDKNAIPESIRTEMYPENMDGSNPAANRDCHIVYCGEILKAYILS